MALKIHGPLPDFKVGPLKRDKTGVFTGESYRYFRVGPKNQRVDPSWLYPSSAPDAFRIPCVEASAEIEKGICIVTYEHEGADSEGGDASFTENDVTFEFDTSFAEEDIRTHPAWKDLKRIYSWNETDEKFAEYISGLSKRTGLSKDRKKGKFADSGMQENPLFGLTSWQVFGAIFRKSWAARTVPDDLFDGIGTIINRPPQIGQFKLPVDGKKRNYLYLPPKVSKRGNVVGITQEWMRSGPKGWPEAIYSKAQFGED